MEQEQTLCRTAFAHFRTVKSRICGSLLTPHSHANTCQVVGVCPKIWDSKNLVLGVSTLPDTPKNELKIQATHGWYTQLFQFLLLESFESLFCCSLVPFQNVVTTSCLSQISIYIYTYNIYIYHISILPITSITSRQHPGIPAPQVTNVHIMAGKAKSGQSCAFVERPGCPPRKHPKTWVKLVSNPVIPLEMPGDWTI